MNHNANFGHLVKQTLVEGYSVAVYISNREPEKQGNSIVTQLVQSYEERKNAFDHSMDMVMAMR